MEVKKLQAKPFVRLPADPAAPAQVPAKSKPSMMLAPPAASAQPAVFAPATEASLAQKFEIAGDPASVAVDLTAPPKGPPRKRPPQAQQAQYVLEDAPSLAPTPTPRLEVPAATPVDVAPPLVVSGGAAPDLAPPPVPTMSPFRASRKATGAAACVKLKLFLFGEPGTGKTLTALSFPRPVVLDLEGGAEAYEDSFGFALLDRASFGGVETNDWDRLDGAVDWLLQHPAHGFGTLVIDPITVAWEACCDLWISRFLQHRPAGRQGHKHEFYDLQPADWRHLKGSLKSLFRKLARLDMHIVAIAREKPLYAEGAMMRRIGETWDGDRGLAYYFDAVVRLEREGGGAFRASVIKSRNLLLTYPAYTYAGALGFSGILAARLRGEPEPVRAPAPQAAPEHGARGEAPVAPGDPAVPDGAYRLES